MKPSTDQHGCPTPDILEALAAGTCGDAAAVAHAAGCAGCRASIVEIKKNQAFLADFMLTSEPGALEPKGRLGGERWEGREGSAPTTDLIAALGPVAGAVAGYELMGELKRGGQGVVYKAVHAATKRKAAIKMPLSGVLLDARDRERFENEITLVARMRHPYIVTVYDSGVTPDGRYYVAMEYVRGMRLDDWCRQAAQRPENREPRALARAKLGLMVKICDAVLYAHQRGVIHRDLKPGNIMVDGEDNPRLLDFGVARRTLPGGAHRTMTGQFAGTLAYASPEQVSGDPDMIDTRTDVYSLGVVLYEMLTGVLPYPVDGALGEVIGHISETPAKAPRQASAEAVGAIDDEVETILLKTLSKDRERRYQTAAGLANDIRRYLAGDAIDAKRDSTLYVLRKAMAKNRGTIAIGASALLGIAAVTAVLLSILKMNNVELARRGKAEEAARIEAEEQRRIADREQRATKAVNRELETKIAELAASYREQRLGTARLTLALGRAWPAEEALWSEMLEALREAPVLTLEKAGLAVDTPPAVLRAWWALSELYAQHPSVFSWRVAGEGKTAYVRGFDEETGEILCQAMDGRAMVLRVGSEAPVRTWTIPRGDIPGVLFWSNADGSRLAYIGDGVFRLVDGLTGDELARTPDQDWKAGAFSPDHRWIAVRNKNGRWRMRDGSMRERYAIEPGDVPIDARASVGFTPDSRRFVAGLADGRLIVIDVESGRVEQTIELPPEIKRGIKTSGGATSIFGFTPDGRAAIFTINGLVLAPVDGSGAVEPIRLDEADVDAIRQNRFADDMSRMAGLSLDSTIKVWDLESGRVMSKFGMAGPNAASSVMAWRRGQMVTGGHGGGVRVWELEPQRWRRERLLLGSVNSARLGPSRREIVCAGADGTVRVLGLDLETIGPDLKGHTKTVSSAMATKDGRFVAATGYDGTMRIWSREDGREVAVAVHPMFNDAGERYSNMEWGPDDRTIVAGSMAGELWVWSVNDAGEIISTQKVPAHAKRLVTPVFSPDGKTLATVGDDGALLVWAWPDHKPRRVMQGDGLHGVRTAAWDATGARLATADDAGRIVIWDARTWERESEWTMASSKFFAVAFHPNGRLLATGDRNGAVRIWDTRTKAMVATLIESGPPVFGLEFLSDGARLMYSLANVTGADEQAWGRVGVWDLGYYGKHVTGNQAFWASRLTGAGPAGEPSRGAERSGP